MPPRRRASSGPSSSDTKARAERVEVVGIVEQHQSRDNLVDDATDARRHNRLGLPHPLGHSQAEAFGQALLHDHGGMALEKPLTMMAFSSASSMGKVKSLTCRRCLSGNACHASMHSSSTATSRVVTDVVDGGAGEGKLGDTSTRYDRREARHDSSHVL